MVVAGVTPADPRETERMSNGIRRVSSVVSATSFAFQRDCNGRKTAESFWLRLPFLAIPD